MSADDDPVSVLSEDESWSLLSSMSLGRLVTILGGQPEIFPVNFVTQRRTVLFRTAQGTKLYSAVMGGRVAFEADDHTVAEGWSVIVKGRAHRAVGQRRHPRGRGSAVAAVDRDVEAPLRTGDRLGDHRPAVQVRPRTGSSNPPSLDDGPSPRIRDLSSAAKGSRSWDFRPCRLFRLWRTVTLQANADGGPGDGATDNAGCGVPRG